MLPVMVVYDLVSISTLFCMPFGICNCVSRSPHLAAKSEIVRGLMLQNPTLTVLI